MSAGWVVEPLNVIEHIGTGGVNGVVKSGRRIRWNAQPGTHAIQHGRRKLIKAKPKKGSPIVDEALLRIAALYKVEGMRRPRPIDFRLAGTWAVLCAEGYR